MQIKALRFFAMVAATESFSATARHFRVPASSVSRHIAALERDVGQQLLFRHTRAVRLTEVGERYYAQVREALELLDAAAEHAVDSAATLSGVIRINAPVAMGRLHIAPLLVDLQRLYPALVVELTLTDAFIDPVQEGADITVRIGHLPDSGLIARPLGPQRYLVCASPSYLETREQPVTPADLKQHNCLVYKGHFGAQRWYFNEGVGSVYDAFDVSGNLRSNNAESLMAAAVAGQGVVLFPSWLYQHDDIEAGRLVPLLTHWRASVEPQPPGIHLVLPENRIRSRKAQLVADYLVERIGSPPYWDTSRLLD